MTACTDRTESVRAIRKECFWNCPNSLVCWHVCTLSVIHRRNWQLSCVHLWALSPCPCRWEVSLFELMLLSTHSRGVRQVEWIKKTLLLNEIWRENRNLVHPGLLEINISLVQICTGAEQATKINPRCFLLTDTFIFSVGATVQTTCVIYKQCRNQTYSHLELSCLRWRDSGPEFEVWRIQSVFWLFSPCWLSLYTRHYSCANVHYFYLSVFAPAQPFFFFFSICTQPG